MAEPPMKSTRRRKKSATTGFNGELCEDSRLYFAVLRDDLEGNAATRLRGGRPQAEVGLGFKRRRRRRQGCRIHEDVSGVRCWLDGRLGVAVTESRTGRRWLSWDRVESTRRRHP